MAQGKLKTKVQLPKGAKQKGSHQKKPLGLKKGGESLILSLFSYCIEYVSKSRR